jgi:hypothetical protein
MDKPKILHQLRRVGADLSLIDSHGRTPERLAYELNNTKMIEYFIANPVIPTILDKLYITTLTNRTQKMDI